MKIKKLLRGEVLSDKMDKTIVVLTSKKVQHPVYKKFITKRSKLAVHDERNEASEGDIVEVVETRPISKNKRYVLKNIVKKAKVVE